MRTVMMIAVLLVGCAGDEVDPGNGPACTKALYDKCMEEHDCMSQNCKAYMGDGIQVCTTTCDASNPCPDFDGAAVECNNMGLCKPPGERDCRIVP